MLDERAKKALYEVQLKTGVTVLFEANQSLFFAQCQRIITPEQSRLIYDEVIPSVVTLRTPDPSVLNHKTIMKIILRTISQNC